MEVYIIRHAQSTNNALMDQGRRSQDPDLTEMGQEQAGRVAQFISSGASRDPWFNPVTGFSRPHNGRGFGLTHLYTSAMYRALLTTRAIAEACGLRPGVWVALHEHGGIYLNRDGVDIGHPGMTRREIVSHFPAFVLPDEVTERGWYDTTQGQEPLSRSQGRAIDVAAELRHRAVVDPNARIGLVTHGTFIDGLLKALLNQLPSHHLHYLHYNTGITRLDFSDGEKVMVRYMNRIDHLPPNLIS